MVFGYLSLDLMCLWLSDFCGLYAWDGCLCSLIWRKMSDFCVLCSWEMVFIRIGVVKLWDFCCLCAWEGCLCSLVWWKWVIFVYYVIEKVVCVVWLGEIECLLMSMCMRMMIMWPATVKKSEFWCLCAWEGHLCELFYWNWMILMYVCLRRLLMWSGLVKLSEFYVLEFVGLWSVMV